METDVVIRCDVCHEPGGCFKINEKGQVVHYECDGGS